MAALDKSDIDLTVRAVKQFIDLYYPAYDSPSRAETLPRFYRENSTIVWNGNPSQGPSGVKALVESMPPTKHDVHTLDCQPIPTSTPPSLLVVVGGTVMHGKPALSDHPVTSRNVNEQPRIFSQTFVLSPDAGATTTNKYFITTDNCRFVG